MSVFRVQLIIEIFNYYFFFFKELMNESSGNTGKESKRFPEWLVIGERLVK